MGTRVEFHDNWPKDPPLWRYPVSVITEEEVRALDAYIGYLQRKLRRVKVKHIGYQDWKKKTGKGNHETAT